MTAPNPTPPPQPTPAAPPSATLSKKVRVVIGSAVLGVTMLVAFITASGWEIFFPPSTTAVKGTIVALVAAGIALVLRLYRHSAIKRDPNNSDGGAVWWRAVVTVALVGTVLAIEYNTIPTAQWFSTAKAVVYLLVIGLLLYGMWTTRPIESLRTPPQLEAARTLEFLANLVTTALMVGSWAYSADKVRRSQLIVGQTWWKPMKDIGFMTANIAIWLLAFAAAGFALFGAAVWVGKTAQAAKAKLGSRQPRRSRRGNLVP